MYEFSENIQRGILFLAKKDREFLVEATNLIKPEYFEYPTHEKIYTVIENYFSKYKKIPDNDVILQDVKKKLSKNDDLADFEDELEYIDGLDTSSIENPAYYMDLVEAFAKEKAMLEAIKESVVLINEGKPGGVEELVKKALMVGREIDLGQKYFSSVKDRWDRAIEDDGKDRIPTILETCNAHLSGGNSKKELCMVVANSGVGKSIFLVNQAVAALKKCKKVLYISLEMSEDKIAARFDSVTSKLPISEMKDLATQLTLHERLHKFKTYYEGSELIIKEFPTAQANVNSIRSLLIKLENNYGFKPDLICVDYLELLTPIRETEQEHTAQMRIAEELRGMAVEYNCLVWTATQTNRLGESVELITKKELGGSYDKIKPTDWAISLNQTTEEYDNGYMRGFILKARDSKQKYIIPMSVNYRTLEMEQRNGDEEEATT